MMIIIMINIVMIITAISSFVAIYLSIKKQPHDTAKTDSEVDNIDADTINTVDARAHFALNVARVLSQRGVTSGFRPIAKPL